MNNTIIEKIFKHTKGFDTHIILNSTKGSLTRFGDNEISQNVSTSETRADVRIIRDGKIVKFIISRFSDDDIKIVVKKAVETLNVLKKAPFIPEPTRTEVKIDSKRYYDEKTANMSPSERAYCIKDILKFCKKTQRLSYGIVSNSEDEVVVANNIGLYQRYKATKINYEIIVNKNNAYGKAVGYSYKNDINFNSINEIAVKKSDMACSPVEIKPGRYTVIIEPLAFVEVFSFFSYLGFNALAYYENRSFASGNLGKKLFSEKVSIIDDPFDMPVMPFDLEGMPRERVVLVENGVLKNVVTDKKTSKLTGLPYTGNSIFEPNSHGAISLSLSMLPGKKTSDEIIADTDRALLVTDFHYTNPLKPKSLEITGMTRNGTYLVENGKIKKAVKNMRFTQSMVEALNNVEDISSDRKTLSEWIASISVPTVKIKNFNFSSGTEF
ncbi:MAG: TldD/PmbA family protein [Elusimicrobiales bacterium]|jgi:predicted Zn-dependent protease|nr:TldD/PmbA family protein [Elusimicrobiales bacterium]